MASSLLALIDDISTILDDVAVLAKVAAKKTAGVMGDDLALNAEQVPSVMTMISADNTKSVRTAPLTLSFSSATTSTFSLASASSFCL